MAGVGRRSSCRGRNAVWGGLAAAIVSVSFQAYAGPLEDAIQGLGAEDKIEASIQSLATLDDPRAIGALDALCDARLRLGADGHVYIWSKSRELRDPLTGQVVAPEPRPLKEIDVSNEIRRFALPVLAQLQLEAPDASVRLAAAEELSKSGSAEAAVMLHRARDREKDPKVKEALELAVARADLSSKDPAARIAALGVIGGSGDDGFLSELRRLVSKGADGVPVEPDAGVRAAADKAIASLVRQQRFVSLVGDL